MVRMTLGTEKRKEKEQQLYHSAIEFFILIGQGCFKATAANHSFILTHSFSYIIIINISMSSTGTCMEEAHII